MRRGSRCIEAGRIWHCAQTNATNAVARNAMELPNVIVSEHPPSSIRLERAACERSAVAADSTGCDAASDRASAEQSFAAECRGTDPPRPTSRLSLVLAQPRFPRDRDRDGDPSKSLLDVLAGDRRETISIFDPETFGSPVEEQRLAVLEIARGGHRHAVAFELRVEDRERLARQEQTD